MKLLAVWLLFVAGAIAENPYLAHPDDQPVTRHFAGKEWGDDVESPDGQAKAPFSAEVTTRRLEKFAWGEIYEITFKPASKREISPYYFLATDDRIYLLPWDDAKEELPKLAKATKAPQLEEREVWGLARGSLKVSDPPWVTTISVRGGVSLRQAIHEGSGHFGRIAWKKGVGLIEFSMGRGALADGFELEATKTKRK